MRGIAAKMRAQFAEARAAGERPREWQVQPYLLESLSIEAMVEEMERTTQSSGKMFLGIPISVRSPPGGVDSLLVCGGDRQV